MIDEPVAPAGKRPRSREQLLRLLTDDPRSVSRAEIKAAFADGRLGDQDLDIPVLAGMRRITDLLSELDPNASSGGDVTDTPAFGTAVAGRATATSARVQTLETQLERLTDRVAALEVQAATDRVALEARESAEREVRETMAVQARRVQLVTAVVAVLSVAVVVLLAVRLANL